MCRNVLHQKFVVQTNRPIFIHCYYQIHIHFLLNCNWNIFNLWTRFIVFQTHIIRCEFIEIFHFWISKLSVLEAVLLKSILPKRNMPIINMRTAYRIKRISPPAYHILVPTYASTLHIDIHSNYLPQAPS